AVEVQIRVFDPVERIVVEVNTLSGHVEREAVSLSPHPLLALTGRGSVGRGAWNQRGQLQVVPSIERQLDDAAILDDGSDGSRLGLDERRLPDDLHGIIQRADLEGQRNSDCTA